MPVKCALFRFSALPLVLTLIIALPPAGWGQSPNAVTHRHNDELNRQEIIRYADGSQEMILYNFRNSVDGEGKQITERVDEYVVRIGEDGKILSITDENNIIYTGKRLTQEESGASCINHDFQKVTIRKDGSRIVRSGRKNEDGKFLDFEGAGYETDQGGRIRRVFAPEGNLTHSYGYKSVTIDDKPEVQLFEYVTTNKLGQKEHWKKSEDESTSDHHVFRLQNFHTGEKIPLEGVDRIDVGRNGALVVRSSDSGNADENAASRRTTTYKLDGTKVEHETIERVGKIVKVTWKAFKTHSGTDPDYKLEVVIDPTDPPKKTYRLTAAFGFATSDDATFWKRHDKAGTGIGYYKGTFRFLDDGTFYQKGFETDEQGNRLIENGKPARERELLIHTNGESIERLYFDTTEDDQGARLATIKRGNEGEVLKTIDVNRRVTSFAYADDMDPDGKDEQGRRKVRGINAYGAFWRDTDDVVSFYNVTNDRLAAEIVSLSINRRTGTVTYESLDNKTLVRLDGSTEVHTKPVGSRRTLNGQGQIVACIDAKGTRCDFEYNDEGTVGKAIFSNGLTLVSSDATTLDVDRRAEHVRDIQIDWHGRITYLKQNTDKAKERHVHFQDGGKAIYDTSGNLSSVTDANGVRTECLYDGKELKSLTRQSDDADWSVQRSDDDRFTLTIREGETEKTTIDLNDLEFSDYADLTLTYAVSDGGHLAYQSLRTDGSRREIWRDFSIREFDADNRLVECWDGDWVTSFKYEGPERMPIEFMDAIGEVWKRSKPPASGNGRDAEHEWKNHRNGAIWEGSLTIDQDGDYIYQVAAPINRMRTDDYEHIKFQGGGGYSTELQTGRVRESEDVHGERFRYEYTPEGTIKGVTKQADDGEALVYWEIPRDLQRLEVNKHNGQPTFVNLDGSRQIHLLNGTVISADSTGKITSVSASHGAQFEVGKTTDFGTLATIRRDTSGQGRLAFENGNTGEFTANGDLIIRNKDGLLLHTVSGNERYVAAYAYDERQQPSTIVLKTTNESRQTTTALYARNSAGRWGIKDKFTGRLDVRYATIELDHQNGGQIRRLRNRHSIQFVNAAGDVVQRNYVKHLQAVSRVKRNAENEIIEVVAPHGDATSYFRNDAGEITVLTRNGYESMYKQSDGTWLTSDDAIEQKRGRVRGDVKFDALGTETWTHEDRRVIRTADGTVEVHRGRSRAELERLPSHLRQRVPKDQHGVTIRYSADKTETTYSYAVGDIATARVRSDGTVEVNYRGFAKGTGKVTSRRQIPGQFVSLAKDIRHKEPDVAPITIRVSPEGTVTELDVSTNQAKVYQPDGTTIELTREVSDDDGTVSYRDQDGNVAHLWTLNAKDPGYLGPEVGIGRRFLTDSITRGLDSLSSSPAPSTRPRSAPTTRTVLPETTDKSRAAEHPPDKTPSDTKKPAPQESVDDFAFLLDALDGNSDGKLSLDEIPRTFGRSLARYDVNRDRAIDRAEFERNPRAFGRMIQQLERSR